MARYRIAVCDDEPSELGDIVQCVKRYDVHGDFDIENYTDGAALLSDLQLKRKFFDLLLSVSKGNTFLDNKSGAFCKAPLLFVEKTTSYACGRKEP